LKLLPVGVRDPEEIERAIGAVAHERNGGVVVTTSTRASAHRDLIVALAARHRLPAAYPFRFYVDRGGLISYGADWTDSTGVWPATSIAFSKVRSRPTCP
jgi:hypothetical protein